jgi:hypothetical protein
MDAMVHYPQVGRLLEGTVDRVKAKLGSTPMRLAHHIDVTVPISIAAFPLTARPCSAFPLTAVPVPHSHLYSHLRPGPTLCRIPSYDPTLCRIPSYLFRMPAYGPSQCRISLAGRLPLLLQGGLVADLDARSPVPKREYLAMKSTAPNGEVLLAALDSVACRAFTGSAWPIDRRVAWLQVGADGLDAVNADRKAIVAAPTAAGPDRAVPVAAGTAMGKIRTKKRKQVCRCSKGSGAPSTLNRPALREYSEYPCECLEYTPSVLTQPIDSARLPPPSAPSTL